VLSVEVDRRVHHGRELGPQGEREQHEQQHRDHHGQHDRAQLARPDDLRRRDQRRRREQQRAEQSRHQRRPPAELLVLREQDGRRDRTEHEVGAGQHHQTADQQQLLEPAVVAEATDDEVGHDKGDHRLGRLQRDVQGGCPVGELQGRNRQHDPCQQQGDDGGRGGESPRRPYRSPGPHPAQASRAR
jgi:hypothetical protein